MQLLDVLVCNSANKRVRMSRSCRFLLFLPHKYQVSLSMWYRFRIQNSLYSTLSDPFYLGKNTDKVGTAREGASKLRCFQCKKYFYLPFWTGLFYPIRVLAKVQFFWQFNLNLSGHPKGVK